MTTRTLGFALLFILVLAPAALASQEQGSWRRLPAAPMAPDWNYRTSVWTGKEMLVFGRDQQTALDANGNPYAASRINVAAAYNPRSDTWRSLDPPRGPTGFMDLSSVWTGKEMLVWGQGTREAFNPVTNTWRRLPGSRLLSIHDGFGAVVWTGRELIGWGGGCCGDAFSDGVAYGVAKNTWRALPRAPLAGSQHPLSVWTGRRMIVISGARAASYEPATNSWKRVAQPPAARGNATAVWDGREVLVFGGTRIGFAYSPRNDSWHALPLVPAGRVGDVAVWTGRLLLMWGGKRGGAAYDPKVGRWSTFAGGPLPVRLEPTAVWTGHSLIVWGGLRTKTWGHDDSSGAVFTPAG
ncbi:MAG TPA: hypothetical protein VK613_13715 [Gaiellaceae bacterium]|nr:hypothetical protein [Gaiellaceae bacterium]